MDESESAGFESDTESRCSQCIRLGSVEAPDPTEKDREVYILPMWRSGFGTETGIAAVDKHVQIPCYCKELDVLEYRHECDGEGDQRMHETPRKVIGN